MPSEIEKLDGLIGVCEGVISKLVAGEYDDGTYPLVTEAIEDLREGLKQVKHE